MENRRRIACLMLALSALLVAAGCESSSAPSPPKPSALDMAPIAEEVAKGVGIVQKTSVAGTKGPIFVFEEVHTSRIGQIQIATMLLRLHDKYGLKKIALEGAIWSGHPLRTGWYQTAAGGQAKTEKEDLAVRMIADGEISSSELMGMLFPDVEVYGIEDANQYAQDLNIKSSPEIAYLLAIAERKLSPNDIQQINVLLTRKKEKQALDYMLTSDPWVKQQYESFKASTNVSSEQLIERLREIQAKADQVGAKIRPEAARDMESEIHFYETASQRSGTMVSNALQLPGSAEAPEAMIIGAAHADKVTTLLTQENVPFSLIQPENLDSKVGSMSVDEYERKVKGQWAANLPGTLGHVLNVQRKPPPVVERTTGHSYASMQLASILIARAARQGGNFPDNIWNQISQLPDLKIDRNSITRIGYDVVFRAWLKQDDDREKEVWARVGTIAASNVSQPHSLEEKLIAEGERLKEGEGGDGGRDGNGKNRKGHGGDEPPDSGGHAGDVPGDFERKGTHIARMGIDTLVAFGSKRDDVMKLPIISR